MAIFWSLTLGVPLLLFGAGACFRPGGAKALIGRFENSRAAALALSAVAWFWTAYECDTIGIDVFDMLLKRFPGQLWLMAALLTFLTFVWMPKNLPVRALTGLLMLLPAELFKTTRLLVPASGFAPVHLLVATAYIGAVVGMYGMFYPWRLERALELASASAGRFRAVGAVFLLWGAALIVNGFFL